MKSAYILPIFLFLSLSALSQTKTYIGFQAGYTKASEDYGSTILPEDAQTHIHGFMAGIIVRKDFGRIYVDLEPQYRRRGAACFPNFTFFTGDTEFQLNYVELPIIVGFKAIKLKKVVISPRIGYSLAYFVNGTSITYRDIGEDRIEALDKRMFNNIDHALHVGVQTSFSLTNEVTLLGTVNHARGLVNTAKLATSKHRAIDVTLGMLYKI